MQNTAHVLMIRPAHFNFNAETAVNNRFQKASSDSSISEKAVLEFDRFVKVLRDHQVDVTVIQDSHMPYTPDSIFPNNWISFHSDGTICLYPMFAENRRMERNPTVLAVLNEKFESDNTIDYTGQEERNLFLEGTGSMVLDRSNHLAYACLSIRTHENLLQQFCDEMGYQPVVFNAVDDSGAPIYHTNVMMCVADRYVVICLESITDEMELQYVQEQILATGKSIIPITMEQMNHFAGNMLQVKNTLGEKLLLMSTQAYLSLDKDQIETLNSYNAIVHADIRTIESNGGGSARCMIAEVFLPLK
jgi:hypothetical protein